MCGSMLPALVLLAALESAPAGPLAALRPLPKDTVRVFLVRHGQALSNLKPRPKLTLAELDHLTELGRQQTTRTAALLGGQTVGRVLASPAGRAGETGALLRKALATPEAPAEARLRPLELGRSPSGQPLGWDARDAEWKAGRDPQPPGGESLHQVADRLTELIASLAREHAGQAIVLVSHGEVIATLVGSLRGLPIADWEDMEVRNGSVTVVEAAAGKAPQLVLVDIVAE
jgi:broad specificity phosphatase PhoE